MGHTWGVWAWVENAERIYDYVEKYAGESAVMAIIVAINCRLNGIGCVKIEWRG